MDQKIKNVVSGALVIDKPIGLTSHDIVNIVRRGTNIRRAGHTGTLDPRASGVLVVLVGPAVRLSEYITADDKRYQATIKLGVSTDTYDTEGKVTKTSPFEHIKEEHLMRLLEGYEGKTMQIPPNYSAVKVHGQPAYKRARSGEDFELNAREIDVYSLELLEWAPPDVVLDVYCSSGTYVRSLANDIGEDLNTGAHLIDLRRTKSGDFTLRQAIRLRELRDAFETGDWYRSLIPAAELLPDWPKLELDNEQVEKVAFGHQLPAGSNPEMTEEGLTRAISLQGDLVAVMQYVEDIQRWQPKKVFYQT
ncbi:MAG: tRNA pseudouridine(55) synthase TruB [Chloroflexota bacterium]|nr:tRNA pseudouridine(55) synthase TruB [Chloroflexota bacterium]